MVNMAALDYERMATLSSLFSTFFSFPIFHNELFLLLNQDKENIFLSDRSYLQTT